VTPASAKPITFIVPGQQQTAEAATTRGAADPLSSVLRRGTLKHSVRVAAQRGADGEVRVTAVPDQDVVVLHIAGGPELILHPETARDLMLAQGKVSRSRGAKGEDEPAPDEVTVPIRLQWRGLEQGVATRGATRGFLGDVVLSAVDVITGLSTDAVAGFTASEVARRVDAQVDPGVYTLQANALQQLKGSGALETRIAAPPGGGPLLVFVHGTFSETHATFGKLWTHHPGKVRSLFTQYRNQVYALDHPTLGVSPIANALMLAKALPPDARLHLVTHSRGGLVAETLARVCANPDDDFAPFGVTKYRQQRDDLTALAALVKERKIRVERVVRVACPARGTLLASKRLDAYVSVFKWALELGGIPVAPALVDFLGAVATRRADPDVLPGLAAQIPDSPLVQWLHAADQRVEGQLRVIAGDLEGDSVTSWLKTLLADAFYWTDNDLVVQTRSMYGGAPRATASTFVLDQGGKVSHFSYFTNERTAEAIVNALVQETPQGFRTIGPLSWAGESSSGARARRVAGDGKTASDKPAVFVLPGILGSNLKVNGQRIWLGWRLINGLTQLAYSPGTPDAVEPDGPIGQVYDGLVEFLSGTHEVIEFAFDWRRPIEDEARRLGASVDAELEARQESGQPVRLVAHSMGGLVARVMQLERPEVWQRMLARAGARVLMLGTPNGGSWAPMQMLSGDDTFGNALVAAGAPFQDHEARDLIARFPGFIQLQAGLLDAKRPLASHEAWQHLADEDLARVRAQSWWHHVGLQLNAYRWGVPSQAVLDSAVALRRRLDAQRDHDLTAFNDKLLLVAGHAPFTPDGCELRDEGLVYLDVPDEGDGRVTLQSAVLPGVRTWTLDCEHGSLPERKDAFEAYLELLVNGTTGLLAPLAAASASRGAGLAPPHVFSRPSRSRTAPRPPETERELLAVESRQPLEDVFARGTALRITVVNGDLTFVQQPLLLGHYRSTRLTGTERVMNRLIGLAMEDSLRVGLYPDPPGTFQAFVNTHANPSNPFQLPRPEAVIVVGLGEEGKLRGPDLVSTVRQAVIGWAQRIAEKGKDAPPLFELAATLMGSGGSGITAGQSAQLIAQGVREANERLDDARSERERAADRLWPRVSHLQIIELYLDRATEAWRALQMQAAATPGRYVVDETVQSGVGALRRPLDSGYRGADYDFISAESQVGPLGDAMIGYTLDTKRARTEVRAQATQIRLLRDLVTRASNDQNTDPQIGRTLFQLLVPVEMEPFLGGTTEMQIEVDAGTAAIPWELLDTVTRGGRDAQPWAIRAKLLRKLRTADFRAQVTDADAESSVLVIGEPECDPNIYPRLSGARDEARAVAARFAGPTALGIDKVKALISPDDPEKFGPDARTVINGLLERDWRIVHIAGHGEPPEIIGADPGKSGDTRQEIGDPRGVVLSNNTFLGPREIRNMRVVPELVFVNCCHIAARDASQLLKDEAKQRPYNRARFAANVAEELIKIGVRCVIAAGWAVEDAAASAFATTFYDAVLRRQRFIDAVTEAREAARTLGGNTWAAYQCYGDPDWTFRQEGADPQRPTPLVDEFAGVASPVSLVLALETLEVQSRFQGASAETQLDRIRYLTEHFAPRWGGLGDVAESFGAACAAAGDYAGAVTWYERALAAPDGKASMKATEQLANWRVRTAWEAVDKANRRRDQEQQGRTVRRAKARTAAKNELASAERSLSAAMASGRASIGDAISLLHQLLALHPTMERESLCGSAYRRLAMIEGAAGKSGAEARAIAAMKEHYARAEALGRETHPSDFFYPALNRMAAEVVLNAGRGRKTALDAARVTDVRRCLQTKVRNDPDFWGVVGLTELRLYETLAGRSLAAERASIESEYQDLYERVKAAANWASVYDTACFVLPKYGKHASAGERKAADALLAFLQRLAEPAEHRESAPSRRPAAGATARAVKPRTAPRPQSSRRGRA
jgi:pimeloyl-ACP methyl ester carboxylesterase